MKVHGIHCRPQDNDCYDQFVDWCNSQGLPVSYKRWNEFDATAVEEGDKVVCLMQDPIGRRKAEAVPAGALNHPSAMNLAVRDFAYPIWRMTGINCPPPVRDFDFDELAEEGDYPYLLKHTAKQMGRGYLVDSLERLEWVAFCAQRFDEERFKVIKFIDTRWSDGFNRMRRYMVCGDQVTPLAIAVTKGWKCKTTEMKPKHQSFEKWVDEWIAFYDEPCPPHAMLCCKSLGIDFAFVDTSPTEDGNYVYWEVNPYMNLRPSGIGPKRDYWVTFANYLFGTDMPVVRPTADELIHSMRTFEGFKTYWMEER